MRHVMMELCKQQNSSIRVLENQLASSAKRVKPLEKDLLVRPEALLKLLEHILVESYRMAV